MLRIVRSYFGPCRCHPIPPRLAILRPRRAPEGFAGRWRDFGGAAPDAQGSHRHLLQVHPCAFLGPGGMG